MPPRRPPLSCVFCPWEVLGTLEVLTSGQWKPCCTACYRQRRDKVSSTLANLETGDKYAFRMLSKPPRPNTAPATPDEAVYLSLFGGEDGSAP